MARSKLEHGPFLIDQGRCLAEYGHFVDSPDEDRVRSVSHRLVDGAKDAGLGIRQIRDAVSIVSPRSGGEPLFADQIAAEERNQVDVIAPQQVDAVALTSADRVVECWLTG